MAVLWQRRLGVSIRLRIVLISGGEAELDLELSAVIESGDGHFTL